MYPQFCRCSFDGYYSLNGVQFSHAVVFAKNLRVVTLIRNFFSDRSICVHPSLVGSIQGTAEMCWNRLFPLKFKVSSDIRKGSRNHDARKESQMRHHAVFLSDSLKSYAGHQVIDLDPSFRIFGDWYWWTFLRIPNRNTVLRTVSIFSAIQICDS